MTKNVDDWYILSYHTSNSPLPLAASLDTKVCKKAACSIFSVCAVAKKDESNALILFIPKHARKVAGGKFSVFYR